MPKPRKNPQPELECFDAEALFEPFVDGDLDAAGRRRLEAHLGSCSACAEEMALARRIKSELGALPALACPPAVSRAVFDYTEAHPRWSERWRAFLRQRRAVLQPAFALAAVLLLAVGYYRLSGDALLSEAPVYSEEEIALAEAELKYALARLGEISDKASTSFSEEVSHRMVAPFSRSIAGVLLPRSPGGDSGEMTQPPPTEGDLSNPAGDRG